jgi:hypothetical protein
MGQDLFDPPNVGGWPPGRAWIHTRALIARTNYVTALVSGHNAGRPVAYDPTALPREFGFGASADAVLTFHSQLLFGTDPSPETRRRLGGVDGTRVVTSLLSSPEAQLG